MVLFQRIKDIFNLNIPIGRGRFLLTYFLVLLFLGVLTLMLSPEILLFEGEEALGKVLISAQFPVSEIIWFVLLYVVFVTVISYCLYFKRLYDVFDKKKVVTIVTSAITIIAIIAEYFLPQYSMGNFIFNLFTLVYFIFLCAIPGKSSKKKASENKDET